MTRREWAALLALTGLTAALSLIGWPYSPPGLHQDELLTGYESWSLAHSLRDQWGAFLPAYFLSWGSGQTVLVSYLNIPFTGLFGLNAYTIRLPELIAGVAVVPAAYLTVRKIYGSPTAWATGFLLLISLWRFQASRWGVEANVLPLAVLLGVATYHGSLSSERAWVRALSLVPWALSFYVYGPSIYVVPLLMVFCLLRDRRQLMAHWRSRLASAGLFLLVAGPMGLAMAKGFLFNGRAFPGEGILPFSLPSLAENRLEQVKDEGQGANLTLFVHGLNDRLPWNSVGDHANVSVILILAAFALALLELYRRRASIFTLWLLACLPLALATPLNTNRANLFILPILVLAARAGVELWRKLPPDTLRLAGAVFLGAGLAIQGALGVAAYFYPAHQAALSYSFLEGLVPAVQQAPQGEEPILIDPEVPVAYVSVLYAEQVPNVEFYPKNNLEDIRIGRWMLTPEAPPRSFLYLTRRELGPDLSPHCLPVKSVGLWDYYACSS